MTPLRTALHVLGLTAMLITLSMSAECQITRDRAEIPERAGARDQVADPERLLNRTDVKFIANRGQIVDVNGDPRPEILYKATANGVDIYFMRDRISYVFREMTEEARAYFKRDCMDDHDHAHDPDDPDPLLYHVYRMDVEFVGVNADVSIVSEDMTASTTNYFLAHCPQGITDVPSYRKLTYKNLYPGIDLVIGATDKGAKCDFVVRPGGRVGDIRLRYHDAKSVEVTREGNLRATTPAGYLDEGAPYSYQESPVAGQAPYVVPSHYRLTGNVLTFDIAAYDRTRTLVIDPTQQWATFWGGSGLDDLIGGDPTEVDRSGNSFIAGYTASNPFPLVAAYQGTYRGSQDCFLVKFDPFGNVVFSTYLGGTQDDIAHGVATDGDGNVFVTGHTHSNNFPVLNAFQSTFGGGPPGEARDGFVSKFNPNGGLLWSTYIGGNDFDDGYGFAVDSSKNVAVVLTSDSPANTFTNPPGTPINFKNAKPGAGGGQRDILVLKYNSSGVAQWGYFLGSAAGTDYAYGAASDARDNILLTGWSNDGGYPMQNAAQPWLGGGNDAVVSKLTSDGVLRWSTFYGGTGRENQGFPPPFGVGYSGMATDYDGNVVIVGTTTGGITTTAGAFRANPPGGTDAYVVKYDSNGALQWATYFGGTGTDYGVGVAMNTQGSVLITGYGNSGNLPTAGAGQEPAFQAANAGGDDAFIAKFDKNGGAKWITYFGGTLADEAHGISYDPYGSIVIAGATSSNGPVPFAKASPTQAAPAQATRAGGSDAYISLFCDPEPVRVDSSGPRTFCPTDSVRFWIFPGYRNVKWWKLGEGGNPDVFLSALDTVTIKESGRFFVRVESAGGCVSGSDTLQVTKLPRLNPVITPAPTAKFCAGDSVELTVSGATFATVQWYRDNNFLPGATRVKYVARQSGVYKAVVSDARGCRDSAQTTVSEVPKPTDITVTPTDTIRICQGEDTLLTANGGDGGNIFWVQAQGNVPGRLLTVRATGTYFAKSVTVDGCEKISNKVYVKVNNKPKPRIAAIPATEFCEGDSAVLFAQAGLGDAIPYQSYRWSPGGETTESITVKESGTYMVTVIDANGCEERTSMTVVEHPIPKPTIIANPLVVCEGDSVDASLGGGPFNSVLWSTGQSSVNSIKYGAVGTKELWAVVTTLAGCMAVTDTITVQVVPRPRAEISGPIAVCTNSPASYTVQTGQGLTISWQLTGPSGTITSGAGTDNIQVAWGGVGNNRVIVAVRDETSGCNAFDTLDVLVGSVLEPAITPDRDPPLCPGDSIILDAGAGFKTYRWMPGGDTTQKIVVKAAGQFTVAVENATGCSGASKPYEVTMATPPKPVITPIGGTTLCPGDTVYLDAGEGYTSYNWPNGNSIRQIAVTQGGTFTVEVKDSNGCIGVSDPVTITMNTAPRPFIEGPNSVCLNSTVEYFINSDPNDFYRWEITSGDGTIMNGQGTNRIQVQWGAAGNATMKIVQRSATTGCRDSATYDVTISTTLEPSISYDRATTQICDGDTIRLKVSSGFATYFWENTGDSSDTLVVTQPGIYTVHVTDAGGCKGSASISVTAKTRIDPTIVPDGMPGLCAGDSLKLTATPGFASYRWTPTGDTTESIWVKAAGSYTVTVTDADGCTGTSAGTDVTFFPLLPTPRIAALGDTLYAVMDTVDAPRAAGYQWNLNTTPINGANGQTTRVSVVGSYTVTVVDSNGCTATSEPYTPVIMASSTVELPPVITAAPGERVTVPVNLTQSLNLDRSNITQFEATLRYRNSILKSLGNYPSVIDGNDRVMTLTGTRSFSGETGELLRLEFLALLGDTIETPLVLETFQWTDASPGPVPVRIVNGIFRLEGLCETGGTRLLQSNGQVALRPARPNPTGDVAEIEYEVVEKGRTQLYLVNMLGSHVATLVDGEIEPGGYLLQLDATRLPQGTYMMILQTPSERVSATLQVVR